MLFVVFWAAIGGAVGAAIGANRNQPTYGLFTGMLFGPLGWLLVAVSQDRFPKCPECLGTVIEGARRCKNCGAALPTAKDLRAQQEEAFIPYDTEARIQELLERQQQARPKPPAGPMSAFTGILILLFLAFCGIVVYHANP